MKESSNFLFALFWFLVEYSIQNIYLIVEYFSNVEVYLVREKYPLIKTASGDERALAPACGPLPVAVNFLTVTGSRAKRLFCVSWSTVYAYRISFAYDKVGGTAIFVPLP